MKGAARLVPFAAALMASSLAWAGQPGSWTGFNAGVVGGYNRTDTDWKTTQLEAPPAFPFTPIAAFLPEHNYDIKRWHAGAFAGYDYQIGSHFVLGAVADFLGDSGSVSTKYIPGWFTSASNTADKVEVSTSWDASVRLRGGFLLSPQYLLFATAGWGGTEREIKITCPQGGNWCLNAGNQKSSFSETLSGWTVGGGFEAMIASHWSLRLDYRYTDYGSETQTFLTGGTVQNLDAVKADLKSSAHAANVGIAYRF